MTPQPTAAARQHVAFILGTRPEAIKMAPVIAAFRHYPEQFRCSVIVTSQHREMLDQVLSVFRITPDHDLNVMTPNQSLAEITTKALTGLDHCFVADRPDMVLVQGDTTTTFAGALAAFYRNIPVGHIEAGLRTYDRRHPFPEEANRTMTSSLADLHFAPTSESAGNLLREGIAPASVHVTGNTVIDALLDITGRDYRVEDDLETLLAGLSGPMLLVTAHRRENHGAPMQAICSALLDIAARQPQLDIVFPVHLSPKVREVVFPLLSGHPRIHLLSPLDYLAFCKTLKRADVVLTDSGGIQEEAPSLGKPVLVMRETTERPEAVHAGVAKLLGTDAVRLTDEVCRLFDDPAAYAAMAKAVNPYGDGVAAQRIVHLVADFLGQPLATTPPAPFGQR